MSSITRPLVHYALQPVLLVGSVALAVHLGDAQAAYPVALLGVVGLLSVLELWLPARQEWRQTGREYATTLALVAVIIALGAVVAYAYHAGLGPVLQEFREAHGLDVWPSTWPLAAQIPLALFTSEFVWYWLHRAEHRFGWAWRSFGHGTHHSFQHLGALHFSANHPFELVVLILPMVIVELLLGAGVAAGGGSILLLTNAAIAHTNLDLNRRGIGWLFTTNHYHRHHHSRILEESNTNYGCTVILWDRLFGTFSDGSTVATGTGESEPDLVGKLLMPFREPADTSIAPVRASD